MGQPIEGQRGGLTRRQFLQVVAAAGAAASLGACAPEEGPRAAFVTPKDRLYIASAAYTLGLSPVGRPYSPETLSVEDDKWRNGKDKPVGSTIIAPTNPNGDNGAYDYAYLNVSYKKAEEGSPENGFSETSITPVYLNDEATGGTRLRIEVVGNINPELRDRKVLQEALIRQEVAATRATLTSLGSFMLTLGLDGGYPLEPSLSKKNLTIDQGKDLIQQAIDYSSAHSSLLVGRLRSTMALLPFVDRKPDRTPVLTVDATGTKKWASIEGKSIKDDGTIAVGLEVLAEDIRPFNDLDQISTVGKMVSMRKLKHWSDFEKTFFPS